MRPLWIQAGEEYNYPADVDRQLIEALGTPGVIRNAGLAVSQRAAGANMSVDVAAGTAFVPGTQEANQGSYLVRSTAVENRSIATAPGSGSRIDLVVAQVRDASVTGSTNAFELNVVTGTPGSSPTPPSAPANSIVLARVTVAAGAASVQNAAIADFRPRSKPTSMQDGLTMDGGRIVMNGHNITLSGGARITDTVNPVNASDLSRKAYVDAGDALKLNLSGGSMSGNINMGNNMISVTASPTNGNHLARRAYVDSAVTSSVANQNITHSNNINFGSAVRVNMNASTVTLPSGWGSMLCIFNGQVEWVARSYNRVTSIFGFETTGGSNIGQSTTDTITPYDGAWHYSSIPVFGAFSSSGNFNIRWHAQVHQLGGSASGGENVMSTRRSVQVTKFRTS